MEKFKFKMIFLIFGLFILSACSAQPVNKYTEKNVPDNVDNFDSQEYLNKLNNIKEGATPKVKPSGNNSSNTNMPALPTPPNNQKQENDASQVQLKNLGEEYSQAILKTNLGDITVRFYAEESPVTVNNFLNLADEGFYDGTRFHRVISDFMIQGGDPLSKEAGQKELWGTGGPGYRFKDEFNGKKLVKGSLAMANSGADTNGSQFFIVTKEATPWLDGKHTNFGEVVSGMEIVEKIEALETDAKDRPLQDVIIREIELIKN